MLPEGIWVSDGKSAYGAWKTFQIALPSVVVFIEGEQLTFRGFPAVMIIKGDNYSLSHGYKNSEQLQAILNQSLNPSSFGENPCGTTGGQFSTLRLN